MSDFELYDHVEKRKGYKFPGIIIGIATTLAGEIRYMVECTAPDCERMLHIFSAKDLRKREVKGAAGE